MNEAEKRTIGLDKDHFFDVLNAQQIMAGGIPHNREEWGRMMLIDVLNLLYPNGIRFKVCQIRPEVIERFGEEGY